jgi:hypothetical protein
VGLAHAYFHCAPRDGVLLADGDMHLAVRFCPKALGRHAARLPIQIFSEAGKLVQAGVDW